MVDFKTKSNESQQKDYKERFEFVFTTDGNIICQRYFRINNFNPTSLRSYELTNAIRRCASVIDRDLRDKTQIYLSIYAPRVFDTKKQMEEYIAKDENFAKMTIGEGLVVRGNTETDFVLCADKTAKPIGSKFDDGELTEANPEDNKSSYKFAFKVDGQEVCSIVWDGYYPKFVRDKIDLSNKRGKFSEEDTEHLTFEQYLLYMMVKDKSDLVYGLIKNICYACSYPDSKDYTVDVDDIFDCWNHDSAVLLYNLV